MAVSEKLNESVPTLQPPGAGLPWWELFVARYVLFPLACRKVDWAGAARQFQEEGTKILAIWDALPAERLAERVLIRRFPGIEDSSRYCSVAMTVEHLNIVGRGIRQIIGSLRQGQIPDRVTRIEDVKPQGVIAPNEVRSEFVRLLSDVASAEAIELAIPRSQGPKYAHPWFGPIDAYQWHCLLGLHQGIHRKQIEAIRKGFDANATNNR